MHKCIILILPKQIYLKGIVPEVTKKDLKCLTLHEVNQAPWAISEQVSNNNNQRQWKTSRNINVVMFFNTQEYNAHNIDILKITILKITMLE